LNGIVALDSASGFAYRARCDTSTNTLDSEGQDVTYIKRVRYRVEFRIDEPGLSALMIYPRTRYVPAENNVGAL
jgi:hypothetical protein